MENKGMATDVPTQENGTSGRRKRKQNTDSGRPRFFLPKPGSTPKNPELGQELATEGDVLVRSFQTNQPFYVLTIWRATADQNGGSPVIVKEAITDFKTE